MSYFLLLFIVIGAFLFADEKTDSITNKTIQCKDDIEFYKSLSKEVNLDFKYNFACISDVDNFFVAIGTSNGYLFVSYRKQADEYVVLNTVPFALNEKYLSKDISNFSLPESLIHKFELLGKIFNYKKSEYLVKQLQLANELQAMKKEDVFLFFIILLKNDLVIFSENFRIKYPDKWDQKDGFFISLHTIKELVYLVFEHVDVNKQLKLLESPIKLFDLEMPYFGFYHDIPITLFFENDVFFHQGNATSLLAYVYFNSKVKMEKWPTKLLCDISMKDTVAKDIFTVYGSPLKKYYLHVYRKTDCSEDDLKKYILSRVGLQISKL